MTDPDQRFTDLEIKVSFQEDALDQLNAVVIRQQRQLDALLRELADLRERVPDADAPRTMRNLRDELPPHY
jgi:SlyX protein